MRHLVVGMSAALLQGARGATEDIDVWFANPSDPEIAAGAHEGMPSVRKAAVRAAVLSGGDPRATDSERAGPQIPAAPRTKSAARRPQDARCPVSQARRSAASASSSVPSISPRARSVPSVAHASRPCSSQARTR